MQVIEHIFLETVFFINNKPLLEKESSYTWLDYNVPEICAGVYFG